MKFYIASLLVISDLHTEGKSEPDSLTMSIPAFIPAESIQAASEFARDRLFERWPAEEGWHTHQANIKALGEKQLDALWEAAEMGILDASDEEQTFNFS